MLKQENSAGGGGTTAERRPGWGPSYSLRRARRTAKPVANRPSDSITHWDGSLYRVGGRGVGVLAAASERLWERAANVLLGPAAGLIEADRLAA